MNTFQLNIRFIEQNVKLLDGKKMQLSYPSDTPQALLEWVKKGYSVVVEIQHIKYDSRSEMVETIQNEQYQAGDWLVKFDDQIDVLFRPVGKQRLCVVTRNDGLPAEIIELK